MANFATAENLQGTEAMHIQEWKLPDMDRFT